MGERTAIGWTDHTFNPWWGCERVSPGCQHCYAETFAKRTGHDVWGKHTPRRGFGEKHWAEPLRWDRDAATAGRPALVFCASMADVFEDRGDLDESRARLFDLIERTPNLIWQLLTKRPERVAALLPTRWLPPAEWPDRVWTGPPNVWIGTTVEDQKRADERIRHLVAIPAPVRFLSCEPLLGRVRIPYKHLACDCDAHTCDADGDLFRCDGCGEAIRYVPDEVDGTMWLDDYVSGFHGKVRHEVVQRDSSLIDWVIIGGESGPGHRPLDLDHARLIVDDCREAGVPVFFKQVGGRTPAAGGHELDGELIQQFPKQAHR